VCAVQFIALPGLAQPADQIAATRKNATDASAKLDDLAADLELRNEEFLQIEDSLANTRAQISSVERELAAALADQDAAQAQLERRVSTIYREGPLGFLDVLVGATDYHDLVTRLDLMRFIGRSDASVVIRVTDARDRIEKAQSALETRQLEQLALRERAKVKQAEVRTALESQRTYLNTINTRLKKLIAAEKKRRELAAAKRAAEIAAAAAKTTVQGGRRYAPSALGAPHPEAVAIARKYVGRTPYLWGGTTPAGFDCSGLVQYCYAQIGVSIPRTSSQQYHFGAFIPANRLDLLMPGDLVFFGRGGDPNAVHHVAMYIGDGQMIHAPQTGELVSISSLLSRIESRGDYVGACRP
jgi:cell wall-associated NlpC family hydrolase